MEVTAGARCPNCAAEVNVPLGSTSVRCVYCGSVVMVSRTPRAASGRAGAPAAEGNLLSLARRYMDARDFTGAVDLLERTLVSDPDDPEVNDLYRRACLARATELYRDAKELRELAKQARMEATHYSNPSVGDYDEFTPGFRVGIGTGLTPTHHHHRHKYSYGHGSGNHHLRSIRRQRLSAELGTKAQELDMEADETEEEAKVHMRKAGVCPECRGYQRCPSCGGSGWCANCDGTGTRMFFLECPKCRGYKGCPVCRGYLKCVWCRGTGKFPPPHEQGTGGP